MTGGADGAVRIWLADLRLINAALTRHACDVLDDETIRATLPSWRGCAAELEAVGADLNAYDALWSGPAR